MPGRSVVFLPIVLVQEQAQAVLVPLVIFGERKRPPAWRGEGGAPQKEANTKKKPSGRSGVEKQEPGEKRDYKRNYKRACT